MRSIPGITIISPADCCATYKSIIAAVDHHQSTYIRLTGGSPNPPVYSDDFEFIIGKANVLREGSDISIFASGTMVKHALEAANLLDAEKINTKELEEDVLKPLMEDLNTPEYISKLHSLYEESSKGNKASKIKFLSACQQIGLLHDKLLWDNFKKSKVKVDENFINQKIKDRNEARKKGNYKLADSLRKELDDNGVIIEDKQEKTTWKYK